MEKDQVALRIRGFRKLKRYTQHQLAEALGISVVQLGAIERGTQKPSVALLEKISNLLHIEQKEFKFSNHRKEE